MSCWTFHSDTPDASALKSAAIRGSVARLSHLSIPVSRRSPRSYMVCWTFHSYTPDVSALKSAATRGSVARLPHLSIPLSPQWPRSYKIYFRSHQCWRFDVLPDTIYSWYTCDTRKYKFYRILGDTTCHILGVDYNATFSHLKLNNLRLQQEEYI